MFRLAWRLEKGADPVLYRHIKAAQSIVCGLFYELKT
jgi:hypothetical protein